MPQLSFHGPRNALMLKKRPSSREANTQMLQWMVYFTYKIWGSFGGLVIVGQYSMSVKNILSCIFADICNIFVYMIISMYIQCTACTKYIYLNLHMTHSRKRVACLCHVWHLWIQRSPFRNEFIGHFTFFHLKLHAMNILQSNVIPTNILAW